MKGSKVKEDMGDQRSILANIVGTMLSSPSAEINMAENFCAFFKKDIDFLSAAADVYVQDLLAKVLNLPKEDDRRQVLLDLIETACFGVQPKMFVHVLSQAIAEGEASAHLLTVYAQKHHQLRTLPKFFSYLLKASKRLKPLEAKLCPTIFTLLADYVVKIPIIQSQSMWTLAWQALEDQITSFKEDPTGNVGQAAMAAEIILLVLLNVRLADYTIRNETLEDFVVKFLKQLTDTLKSLTELAVENPQNFLSPLLKVAFAYGELHHLLLLYSPAYAEINPFPAPDVVVGEAGPKNDVNFELFDMSYFHSYGTAEQWAALGQLTGELDWAIPLWGRMMVQKVRHLVLFNGLRRDKPAVKKPIAWLVERLDHGTEPIWMDNLKYLVLYVTPRQLETLSRKIIGSQGWIKALLLDPDFTDNRSFQMAIICAVFRSIHDQSRKRKASEEEEKTPSSILPAGTQSVFRMLSVQADVWIGSVDRQAKEVGNWLRQSADVIKESMGKLDETSAQVVPLELLNPLELIESLPLEYLIGSAHAAALMGLLSLLTSCCPNESPWKDRLWMMLLRLLDNSEKNSSLYDYLPSAELLSWAVSSGSSSLAFSVLFDQVLRSPQGLKDASTWIKSTDLTSSSLSIAVMAMKKLAGNQKPAAAKMFSSLRKHFLKSFEAVLDGGDGRQMTDVLHGAFCLVQLYVQSKTDESKRPKPKGKAEETNKKKKPKPKAKEAKEAEIKPVKIKALLKKLDRIVDACRQGILSADEALGSVSSDLLHFLLAHQKLLAAHLPTNARVSIWTAYRLSSHPPRWEDRLLRQLLTKGSKKELVAMVNAILDDLQSVSMKLDALEGEDETGKEAGRKEVQRVCSFFRHLATAELPTQDDRYGIRLQAVQTAIPVIKHVILSQCRRKDRPSYYEDVVQLALPPMSIYLALLNLGPSYAYPHDVASALHACLALPLDGPSALAMSSHVTYDAVFTAAYKVLHYLLVKHEEVAADRIPVLMQVYGRLLSGTCARSDQRRLAAATSDSGELACMTDCANRLSRLASVINSQRLRYRRTAAYLVADVMEEFKKRPIHPAVRQELTAALHHLMDLLDQHATRYLLASLPAGLRELFRIELDHFGRFYKFRGKV